MVDLSIPSALAKASAVRFIPIINVLNPTIGEITAHHAKDISPLALDIINPQSGVGGLTPKPKNDRELNQSNIQDHLIAPSTKMASLTLGNISFQMIDKLLCPLALAETMKSFAITSCVAALATLTIPFP